MKEHINKKNHFQFYTKFENGFFVNIIVRNTSNKKYFYSKQHIYFFESVKQV